MANQGLLKANRNDDFQTPHEALSPLLPYLPKRIWECACGIGILTIALRSWGFKIIDTDINTGQDFLSWTPDEEYDCILTNPPYTLKDQFLKRCYELSKPFALLLPLTTLEGKRQKLLKEYGIEIVLLNKRINFFTLSGQGSGSWFATAWFTNGLNLGKQLNYGTIGKEGIE